MSVTCGWCGQELPSQATPEFSDELSPDLPGGLCTTCAQEHVGHILDQLDTPVLAVTGQASVVLANRRALEWLGKDTGAIQGQSTGDAIDCANATLPGGCGHTPGCKTCVIRDSTAKTWQTGQSLNHVPAILTRQAGGTTERVRILISTRRLNGLVVLQIERARRQTALDAA